MITIIDAHVQRGWDANDHLINDGPAHDLIGRTYRDRRAMLAAIDKAKAWPIAVTYTLTDGTRRRRYLSGSPTVHVVDEEQ